MLRPSYSGGGTYPPRPGEPAPHRYNIYPGAPGAPPPPQSAYTGRDGVFPRQPPQVSCTGGVQEVTECIGALFLPEMQFHPSNIWMQQF